MTEFYDFTSPLRRRAIRIDSRDPFSTKLDLSSLVEKKDDGYSCKVCGKMLVRIEPNGILGKELNQLDTTVILDHHMALH